MRFGISGVDFCIHGLQSRYEPRQIRFTASVKRKKTLVKWSKHIAPEKKNSTLNYIPHN